MTLIGGAAVARSRARPHEPLRAPDSVQSKLRNVPWIGLELTSLDAPEGASVALRFAHEGLADEWLVLGSFDPTHVNVEIQRLQALGTFPAGAQATIARVWRGRTAIPSAEAVNVTRPPSGTG